MKVKRIFAPDMKNAMRRVREEIGPDAVILSNKRVAGGVEVVASPESEYESAQQALKEQQDARRAQQIELLTKAGKQAEANREALDRELQRAREKLAEHYAEPSPVVSRGSNRQIGDDTDELVALLGQRPAQGAVAPRSDERIEGLQAEVAQLKQLLTMQLQSQQLAPQPEAPQPTRRPVRHRLLSEADTDTQSRILRRLERLGVSDSLATSLVAGLEPALSIDKAWRNTLARFAESLPVSSDELIARGGMIAFVGPTGAGKTTTIGKLAARYVLENGSAGVALVTTDSYRIAAHEQLKTFGRILDVPVRVVDENNPLEEVLASLRTKRLVLIDTAGMNLRDPAGQEQYDMLASVSVRMKRLLVLSTSSQKQLMKQAYATYAPLGLHGCILTKLDESGSLGEALGLAIQHQLRINYVTDGQRVPDDIDLARRKDLVSRAVILAQQSSEAPAAPVEPAAVLPLRTVKRTG